MCTYVEMTLRNKQYWGERWQNSKQITKEVSNDWLGRIMQPWLSDGLKLTTSSHFTASIIIQCIYLHDSLTGMKTYPHRWVDTTSVYIYLRWYSWQELTLNSTDSNTNILSHKNLKHFICCYFCAKFLWKWLPILFIHYTFASTCVIYKILS